MTPLKPLWCALVILLASCATLPALAGEGCTTAVITTRGTTDGRPLLWKNRDTDSLSNKVVFVDERPFKYVAVVNAPDTAGRIVWGGLNEAGFAIINSVAYNLPLVAGEQKDLEGRVMADALRTCGSVEDFQRFLTSRLGPSLGCQTNFVVIDARGGAAIFETHNHGFERLDADTVQSGCLLNTNFSRSGTPDKGAGYLRFDRERALFARVPPGRLTGDFILQTAARDLGHALLPHPERAAWRLLPADSARWIHTNHTIDRASTACTILIQGVKPGEDPRRATLWVILGEPVCSIAVPVWVAAGETPAELRSGAAAPIYLEARRLRGLLRPLKGPDRGEYADLTRLDNRRGTGWLPATLKAESEILRETEALLARNPEPATLAEFEKGVAARALRTLQGIK